MLVKPAPGLIIRDPDLKDYLPDEGRDVPETDYWHRRVRDGDVVAVPAPAAATADPVDAAQPAARSVKK